MADKKAKQWLRVDLPGVGPLDIPLLDGTAVVPAGCKVMFAHESEVAGNCELTISIGSSDEE